MDVNNDGNSLPVRCLAVINEINGEGQASPRVSLIVTALQAAQTTPSAAQFKPARITTFKYWRWTIRPTAIRTAACSPVYTDLLYDKSHSQVRVAEIQTLTLTGTNEHQTISVVVQAAAPPSRLTAVIPPPPLQLTPRRRRRALTKLRQITALSAAQGAVVVTGPNGGPFDVEFKNTLASTDVAQIVSTNTAAASVATAVQGGGDKFTLSLNGKTTADIPFSTVANTVNVDAPDIANINAIQSALKTTFPGLPG